MGRMQWRPSATEVMKMTVRFFFFGVLLEHLWVTLGAQRVFGADFGRGLNAGSKKITQTDPGKLELEGWCVLP